MWQLLGHINAVYTGTWLLLRQRCTKSWQCICHNQTSETNVWMNMKMGKVRLWFWRQVEHSLKGKATAVVTVPSPKVKSWKAISVEPKESFVLLTRHWIGPLALLWQLKSQDHWCHCFRPTEISEAVSNVCRKLCFPHTISGNPFG